MAKDSVKVDTSKLQAWYKSINKALNKTTTFKVPVSFSLDMTDKSAEEITRMALLLADPTVYEEILIAFMEEGLAKEYFNKKYYEQAQSHLPEYQTWKDGQKIKSGVDTKMIQGIREISRALTKITKPTYGSDGSSIYIHMGDISSLVGEAAPKISEYMGLAGRKAGDQDINNLFMAVEFGTGMADKVGNSSFVRNAPNKETDGSWFLGNTGREGKGGIQFKGQEAIGGLWDKGTRGQNEELISYIEENLGPFIEERIRLKFKLPKK